MICHECGTEHYRKRSKYCSAECGKLQISTPDVKSKISMSRKKFLKENPDKHPWKNSNKFKSNPCEKLKEYLDGKNIKYVAEWQPLEDRYFSIDIAFPDIKVGIEVNGNQHYTSDGSLTEYYKTRHDLIEAAGWKLIELHYSSCYNTELIDSLLNVKEQPDYTGFFKAKEEKLKAKIKAPTLPRGVKRRNALDKKWDPFKIIVLNSNIDFSKFGWVAEVATLLNIKSQKVNMWMKRYLPDFYETACFKRQACVPQRSSKPQMSNGVNVGSSPITCTKHGPEAFMMDACAS